MLKHHVQSTGLELTDAISDYLSKKLESLEKFVEDGVEALAKVEVGKTTHHHHKGDIFKAEIHLSVGKKSFYANAETSDLYAAIDQVKDEIVAEVTKSKRKSLHLLRRGHQKIKNMIKGIFGRNKN